MKVLIKNKGEITLNNNDHIATGGQGSVYNKGKTAFKIYTDPSKMIATGKIKELSEIKAKNVLAPQNLILDCKHKKPIGFTMQYIKDTKALCKLFTKKFRKDKNISPQNIIEIIKKIQQTVAYIHSMKCLIVDMNEMNFLIDKKNEIPYFIDVDSYQTRSFPANAIMDSVRDRLAKKFTELSDWFSFAIVAFQLYIGIHPYKGKHPKYKPKEWAKRMNDGVSVFDKDVTLPSVCQDFSVIPKAHMKWFKSLFVENKRSIPPIPDASIEIAQVCKIIQSTAQLKVKLIHDYKQPIKFLQHFNGINYIVTDKYVFSGKKPQTQLKQSNTFLCKAYPNPIIATFNDNEIQVEADISNTIKADKAMISNGILYYRNYDALFKVTIDRISNKNICNIKKVANILPSSKVFTGIVFQDILGKCWVVTPDDKYGCLSKPIKELDKHRIIHARYQNGVCICLVEKNGEYKRVTLIFNIKEQDYTFQSEEESDVDNINFVVLQNGVCISVTSDTRVEIFKGNQKKIITNPPIDSSMSLYSDGHEVFFIEGTKLFSIKSEEKKSN